MLSPVCLSVRQGAFILYDTYMFLYDSVRRYVYVTCRTNVDLIIFMTMCKLVIGYSTKVYNSQNWICQIKILANSPYWTIQESIANAKVSARQQSNPIFIVKTQLTERQHAE